MCIEYIFLGDQISQTKLLAHFTHCCTTNAAKQLSVVIFNVRYDKEPTKQTKCKIYECLRINVRLPVEIFTNIKNSTWWLGLLVLYYFTHKIVEFTKISMQYTFVSIFCLKVLPSKCFRLMNEYIRSQSFIYLWFFMITYNYKFNGLYWA